MEPELTEPFKVHRTNSESKRNQDMQILLESMEQTLKKMEPRRTDPSGNELNKL